LTAEWKIDGRRYVVTAEGLVEAELRTFVGRFAPRADGTLTLAGPSGEAPSSKVDSMSLVLQEVSTRPMFTVASGGVIWDESGERVTFSTGSVWGDHVETASTRGALLEDGTRAAVNDYDGEIVALSWTVDGRALHVSGSLSEDELVAIASSMRRLDADEWEDLAHAAAKRFVGPNAAPGAEESTFGVRFVGSVEVDAGATIGTVVVTQWSERDRSAEEPDSVVCATFDNGTSQCKHSVEAGGGTFPTPTLFAVRGDQLIAIGVIGSTSTDLASVDGNELYVVEGLDVAPSGYGPAEFAHRIASSLLGEGLRVFAFDLPVPLASNTANEAPTFGGSNVEMYVCSTPTCDGGPLRGLFFSS
jgi:hypothetical protein